MKPWVFEVPKVVASLSPWSSAEHLLKTLASQRDLRLTVASFTTSSPTSPTSPTSTFSWWMVIGSLERMKVDTGGHGWEVA